MSPQHGPHLLGLQGKSFRPGESDDVIEGRPINYPPTFTIPGLAKLYDD
ncbi:MAG: hypothetical protein IH899_09220 [Planctomycetes bacterium]|nr:hypothetical protein [Planctomycetota bacterium]